MPWSKASPPHTPNAHHRLTNAVPSSEAIRRAALSASWRRDRRVARRRLAFRWLLWAFWRIGLPLLLTLGLAAALLWHLSPARLQAWLLPVQITVDSPAGTSINSEQRPHRKEP